MFNVVEGRASDWGVSVQPHRLGQLGQRPKRYRRVPQTSPWHYYFTRALPRLVPSLPLGIWSMVIDRRSRGIGYPSLLYIVALSFLSHKEWRFFVSAIPALNICSAAGVHTVGILCALESRRASLLGTETRIFTDTRGECDVSHSRRVWLSTSPLPVRPCTDQHTTIQEGQPL